MDHFLQYTLYLLAVFSAGVSFYYSIKSRKSPSVKYRGLYAANTNIGMGAMLIAVACIQLFLFPNSWVRLIVGLVFLLLGSFNLFAGLRNHGVYRWMKDEPKS